MTSKNFKPHLTPEPIDYSALERDLCNPSCGALVTFVGRVRNHQDGQTVTRLDYEAYVPMATSVFTTIIKEAREKFGVADVRIVHRVGALAIGDVAVWVGVQSGHRGEAFAACRYAIDQLKTRAPIWKKEHYTTGESAWVSCCHHDSHP